MSNTASAPPGTTLDREALRAAIGEADLRVLLMVLFHLSGDRRWLSPPFRPKRDVRLVADPGAGLAPRVQAEIRASALELLGGEVPGPAITDPGDALMQEMMSACLGEEVPAEYAPVTREEMGFVSRDAAWREPPGADALARYPVLIVGAGVCGIALGVRLGRLGIPYTIVEKNSDLGGTWFDNRYPGCGVDTPNHSYSFSFGPRHPWSRYFSPREEILTYLEETARRFGVHRHLRLQTRLMDASWDEAACCWTATLCGPSGTERLSARVLVSAIGQLNDPSTPYLQGAERFQGMQFHSALWPDALDVAGRHVAVVGTGASAMQIVPSIADTVESLTIYQRSPQWARPVPGYHDLIGEGTQWLLDHAPFYGQWFRFTMFWRYGDGLLPFLRKDPDWPHPERSLNRINDRHREEMTAFIESELEGMPEIARRCIPTYPPYGKRILLDNGWYRTLRKPGVELVSEPIAHIDEGAVVTADGVHRNADVLVMATGFKVGEMAARLGITGRGGRALRQAWADDDPTAYVGLTVPGFPNFFCMLGPNSGLGHGGSTMFQAECQARYISASVVQMVEGGLGAMEVRQDVHDDYVRRVDAEHEQMIWSHPGMTTYYRNARGRVFSVMPWRLVDYWAMTHDPDLAEYHLTPRP